VKDRIHSFGKIENGKMIQNQCGDIAEMQWVWLAQQYKYVILHEFVVMPNHIHGVIEIDSDAVNYDFTNDFVVVGTCRNTSLQQQQQQQQQQIKIKSLSELMGAYKTTVSKQIHLLVKLQFQWQRSFHDHIIRNQQEYERIENYIKANPENWKEDDFF